MPILHSTPLSTTKICTNLENFVFYRLWISMYIYFFVWLYKFSLKSFWKKNIKTANNLVPGTCVLKSPLRDEVRMGKACFRAKKLWVRVATTEMFSSVIYLLLLTMKSGISFWQCNGGMNLNIETVQSDCGSKLCNRLV